MREEGSTTFNQEFSVGVEGVLDYQLNQSWTLKFQTRITHRAYEPLPDNDRTVFHLAPQVAYITDDFQVQAGINWAVGKDSSGGFNNYLYPLVDARCEHQRSAKCFWSVIR